MAGIWKQRAGETWEDGKKLDLFWEKPSVKNTRQLSEMMAAIPIFKIVLSGIVDFLFWENVAYYTRFIFKATKFKCDFMCISRTISLSSSAPCTFVSQRVQKMLIINTKAIYAAINPTITCFRPAQFLV